MTVSQIRKMNLPNLPRTQQEIGTRAKREGWQSRPRQTREGGQEYHISSLPLKAQVSLTRRQKERAKDIGKTEIEDVAKASTVLLNDRAQNRLTLVHFFNKFNATTNLKITPALQTFCVLYNNTVIDAPDIPIEEDLYDKIHKETHGIARRIAVNFNKVINLAKLNSFEKEFSLEDWGSEPFFTNTPPPQRKIL